MRRADLLILLIAAVVLSVGCTHSDVEATRRPVVNPTLIEFPDEASMASAPLGLKSLVGSPLAELDLGQCDSGDPVCFVVEFHPDGESEQLFIGIAGNSGGSGPLGHVLGDVVQLSLEGAEIDVWSLIPPGYEIRLPLATSPTFLNCPNRPGDYSMDESFVYQAHLVQNLHVDISCFPKH